MAVFKNGIFINYNGEIINPVSNIPAAVATNNFFQSTGITNQQQRYAVYNLVSDLQSYNIWNKMKAVYPFVGQAGVSSSFEVNLKDPNTFRGTFSGSVTYSQNGITGNGINAYMNTNFSQSINQSANNLHISIYQRNILSGPSNVSIGLSSGGNNFSRIYMNFSNQEYLSLTNTAQSISSIESPQQGMFTLSRNSSSNFFKKQNNLSVETFTSTSTTLSPLTYILLADNANNTVSEFSQANLAFCSLGDGLTDTEAANFYTAVQRFQTTLGRQV